MQNQDSITQSSEHLRQAIPLLTKLQLKPTPVNYAVIYQYVASESLALNEIIDNTMSEKKPFSEDLMTDLYEKYFNGGYTLDKQEKVQQGLEKIIGNTSDEILHVNQDANNFDESLNKYVEKLATTSASDPDASAIILKQIVRDTRAISKSTHEAQQRMEASNKEIEKMKAELRSVKAMAEKDALTGLKNRGAFDTYINELVHKKTGDDTHHLLMLDIDHFKRINDSFGHLVGDRVIRYVSALMKQIFGEDQHIARYGGEEFAVILHNKTMDQTFELAEKARIAMGNSKLQRKDSGETIGKVTISAGVSLLKTNDTVDEFIDRADKALYSAKETGRNKVVLPT